MKKFHIATMCLIAFIAIIAIVISIGLTVYIVESDLPDWAKVLLLK